jgi:hypothetical protein
MDIAYSDTSRRLGIYSAALVVVLLIIYAVSLTMGLLSLDSPEQPIGDPIFSILGILIIIMMPSLVTLMVAIHAWAPVRFKIYSMIALIFISVLAGITSSVHFIILTLSRNSEFINLACLPLFVSFRWPSVFYALDILGWDVFFALSMLFAARVFWGNRLAIWIRVLMIASGVLALAGLIGVVAWDMQIRNIGIVGYVGVFLIVAVLLIFFFYRDTQYQI